MNNERIDKIFKQIVEANRKYEILLNELRRLRNELDDDPAPTPTIGSTGAVNTQTQSEK